MYKVLKNMKKENRDMKAIMTSSAVVMTCVLLSACMSDNSITKSPNSNVGTIGEQATNNAAAGGTRHVSDGGGDWTDTPANEPPPILDISTPVTDKQNCSQSKMIIIGSEQGCYFSLEEYQSGELQMLACENGQAKLNGKKFNHESLLGYKLLCQ